MAIAYDAATHSGFLNGTSNNLTHSTSGSDRLLLAHVYAGNSDNVTGVTYNSVGMTLVDKLLMTGAAAGQYIYIYYLLNPASGSNTLTVSSSTALGGYISAVSYTGVKQTGALDGSNKGGEASGSTSISVSVNTTSDNAWLMGFFYTGTTMSAGSGTTLRGGSVAGILQTADSNGPKTPTGAYNLNVTHTSSFNGAIVAAFAPSVAATTNSNFFALMN